MTASCAKSLDPLSLTILHFCPRVYPHARARFGAGLGTLRSERALTTRCSVGWTRAATSNTDVETIL